MVNLIERKPEAHQSSLHRYHGDQRKATKLQLSFSVLSSSSARPPYRDPTPPVTKLARGLLDYVAGQPEQAVESFKPDQ
ncbi:hypothetical protein OIU84_024660 [Salix udensis]|uniref:Uncharacterized protein n=1 Tax=Salix udensis TaxID=889485 RepID=A0AAD6KHR3_9ROSI|nr:hypothetical protein OIU84_024660 [Salix udensis]